MRTQERIYRLLLLAYPRGHRSEYGDAMAQMMRDRVRHEGGGARTLFVWASLLVDLVRSAAVERVAGVRSEFRAGWWRAGAMAVALVVGAVGIRALTEPATGAWYQYTLGRLALLAAPVVIVAGLKLRARRELRVLGGAMVAVGLLPGAAAIALFWFPPFLLFGLFSIAMMIGAINDAEEARRLALAPAEHVSAQSATWSPPSAERRHDDTT